MGRKKISTDTWRPIHIDQILKGKYIRDTADNAPIGGNNAPTRFVIEFQERLPNGERLSGRRKTAATLAAARSIRAEMIARYNQTALTILNREGERLEAVAVSPGAAPIVQAVPCPTFREAVTDPALLDSWLIDMGKSKEQRRAIIRELSGKPMEILGSYRLDQIGKPEWELFRTTLLNTRTRHGIRKQMSLEDALLYRVEMRRLKRQSKEEAGGQRYASRPRKGAEIAHETIPMPFLSADRVKRLRAYVHNLFDAANNKGVCPNPWTGILFVPNKGEDRARAGRIRPARVVIVDDDEEAPSSVRLNRAEVRDFISKNPGVIALLAILQAVFGCRFGEAIGAKWGQLQRVGRLFVLDITHQVSTVDNKPKRTTRLKTPKSKRKVLATPLDADLIDLLGPRGADNEFICTGKSKLPGPRVIQEAYLMALMNTGLTHRTDRPDATPHAFRSYCISRWLNNEDVKLLRAMALAGHEDPSTTTKFYLETDFDDLASEMIREYEPHALDLGDGL